MPHNPQGLQSVPLSAFGGLITNALPESLPEGASPMNWDVQYLTGSVGQRDGLISIYTLFGA